MIAEAGSETHEVQREPLSLADVDRIKRAAARQARNKFYGYVDLEDMTQEAEAALLSGKAKVTQYMNQGDKVRLFSMVYKACDRYGQKQKAAAIGYRTEDLFFYSIKVLRNVIPVVLESWSGDVDARGDVPDTALWLDISEALRGLSEAEYQIIWWAFKGDPDQEAGTQNVADRLGISHSAARGRIDRLLRRIQDSLGGESPHPRRKARSNAASMAETREAWNGEA